MGVNYSDFRRPDPRIEAAIWNALGDARSVVNVGAGAGSYEPTDRKVIAVEPSPVMIAQRPPEAAPALEGVAEALPLEDKSVDAAMGVLTIHHWLPSMAALRAKLPGAGIEAVPVPRGCLDGFTIALWDRPEMLLDPEARRASSIWHRIPPEVAEPGLERLRSDLESGRWDEKYGHLRAQAELDIGLRLACEEL
jgi:hypothetical protein